MPKPGPGAHDGDLSLELALVMRARQARLAAHYAARVEQARAAGQHGAMRHGMREYRRATIQCRLLGERIRGERPDPLQRAAKVERNVARLARRSAVEIRRAGEAA